MTHPIVHLPIMFWLANITLLGGCGLGLAKLDTAAETEESLVVSDTGAESPDADGAPDGDASDGGAGTGGGGAGDDPSPGFGIVAITPQHGPNTGATEVTIEGGPFVSGATAKIDGAEIPIIETHETHLIVQTPSDPSMGWRSIEIANPGGESDTWSEGFHYWEDGSNMAGALGEFHWFDGVGAASAEGPIGSAWIQFIDPRSEEHWQFYAPAMDTCRNLMDDPPDPLLGDHRFGLDSIDLVDSSGHRTTLAYDEDWNDFSNFSMTTGDWKPSESYHLQYAPGPNVPPLAVDNFIQTPPRAFSMSTPALDGASPPYFRRGQQFVWEAGDADWVLIVVDLLDITATAIEQRAACVVTDDGEFKLDRDLWTVWGPSQNVVVFISKAYVTRTLLPHNNSEVRTAALYGIYGLAISRGGGF